MIGHHHHMKIIMEISLTIFDSIYDNQTVKRMDYKNFEEFEEVFYRLAESSKYPTKSKAPLISPATYLPDTTRANDNVVAWGGFGIIDVDDFQGDIKDIESKYERYKYLCYSTASSSISHPKFRLVFPLTKWIQKENIKHFWYALNKEIGDIADAQTKDLSRMYYIPSKYKNSFNFIFSHENHFDRNSFQVKDEDNEEAIEALADDSPEQIKTAAVELSKEKNDDEGRGEWTQLDQDLLDSLAHLF